MVKAMEDWLTGLMPTNKKTRLEFLRENKVNILDVEWIFMAGYLAGLDKKEEK